ncbi:MAG: hypothetical protein HXY38_12515 [Chloroflexi bacterium]|nr:hypothetical protein [Chloroflexota bacterium]
MSSKHRIYLFFCLLVIAVLACNAPASSQPTEEQTSPAASVTEEGAESQPGSTVEVTHVIVPSASVSTGKTVFDVESSGTGPEGRAPYGDTYEFNLLERPFTQDMTYIPDLDIESYSMSQDENFHYMSIKLIGSDPNNSLGIHYGVEIDTDMDGFGNFVVLAKPPYAEEWTAASMQVFEDTNHNTSGTSPVRADAPFDSDGYETMLFDGATGFGDDPDLAWVRLVKGEDATLQIAFKRSLAGDVFMAGIFADAGLKDVGQMDYVDRFTEEDAGSSVRDKKTYPLKALFSVDNTCRDAFGFQPTGYEPMICAGYAAPASSGGDNNPGNPPPPSGQGCTIQPSDCTADAPFYWPYPHCACSSTPFYENP